MRIEAFKKEFKAKLQEINEKDFRDYTQRSEDQLLR